MKAYTDILQSKRLAEILPIESADMIIVSIGDREGVVTTTMPKETFNMLRTPFTDVRNTISCWSLAALLNLCPTINGKQPILTRGRITRYWYCYYKDEIDTQTYDNPVDAAFEMIQLLHEQKLL